MESLIKPAVLSSVIMVSAMLASSSFSHVGAQVMINVNGTLYCTANGNSSGPSAPSFPNATVQVACSTADQIFDAPVNGKTNSNGMYLVSLIRNPNATVSSISSKCRIMILTPLSSCNPLLPSVGLVSDLRFVKNVYFGFMYTTYMAASGFTAQL